MGLLITKQPARGVLLAAIGLFGVVLSLLFAAQILLANPETWYLRIGAGASCGNGDLESLIKTAGTTTATKLLDGVGDTWSRTESTGRSMASGNW